MPGHPPAATGFPESQPRPFVVSQQRRSVRRLTADRCELRAIAEVSRNCGAATQLRSERDLRSRSSAAKADCKVLGLADPSLAMRACSSTFRAGPSVAEDFTPIENAGFLAMAPRYHVAGGPSTAQRLSLKRTACCRHAQLGWRSVSGRMPILTRPAHPSVAVRLANTAAQKTTSAVAEV